jgi:hypothetical protein
MLVSGAASSIAGGLTPSEHFNTVLYTGNNSTNVITGVGFQSDLIWFKGRSAAQHHQLSNSQFAVGEHLTPNNTNGTITSGSGQDLTSIDSDGFTLGSSNFDRCNVNGTTYVAWNWKANGAGVSNTNGTIASTVSANTDAGFSIVSYTGNGVGYGSGGSTIGHGLSKTPEFVVVKRRDAASSSVTYHPYQENNGNGEQGYMHLNETQAYADYHEIWADTKPTASVFTVGNASNCNANNGTYVAYCFHSVEGYSKVGSYTGNGSSQSISCGFEPAFVMIKQTNAANNWLILDNARDPDKQANHELFPNLSDSENTYASDILDFTSTGFDLNIDYDKVNGNGSTYIYLAIAG